MASFRRRGCTCNNKKKCTCGAPWEYRVKYIDPGTGKAKEKSKSGFKSKKEAQLAAAEIEKKIYIGQHSVIENQNVLIKDWLEKWLHVYGPLWSKSTLENRTRYVHQKFIPRFGYLKLSHLKRMDYQEFLNDLSKEYKRSTVQTIHSHFCCAINKAVEQELLSDNKFTFMDIKEDDDENELDGNFLTREELQIFLQAARTSRYHHYAVVETLLRTGMRKGELLALTWDDIDLDKKEISISKTRNDYGVKKPKTKSSYRAISIDNNLVAILQKYKEFQEKNKKRYGGLYQESDYVFTKYRGEELGEYSINKILDGILNKTELHHITPHGLRHTHAIMLLESGVDIKTVSERLGHASIAMTSDVYLHVTKQHEEASVSKFEDYLKDL